MIKVLVIDDSALVRKLLGGILSSQPDIEVFFASNGLEGLELVHRVEPNVVTLDVHMPRMDGLACLDRIMVERPCPVVMVSSLTRGEVETTLEALRLGAVDFVAKPEGAMSLHLKEFTPELIGKVRAAALAKLPASVRLRERVLHRMGASYPRSTLKGGGKAVKCASGAGVVLVGCSTGGPSALEALLTPLAATFPWPIVVAQHMPATFTGSLARRLDGICALKVAEVSKPVELRPGYAYIGQGDADVVVSERSGRLFAAPASGKNGYLWRPSVNRLVESAMDHVPPKQLIGVLMTGMGDDGASAMTRLKASGGRTIAEAEETAVVWGMPGELVKAHGADWILPLPRIAEHLQRLAPCNAVYQSHI